MLAWLVMLAWRAMWLGRLVMRDGWSAAPPR